MRLKPHLTPAYLFQSALIITLILGPFIFPSTFLNPLFVEFTKTGKISIVIILLLLLVLLSIVGLALLIMFIVKIKAERTEYQLKEHGLEIKESFIIKKRTFIPYKDITNIYITQTPLQRKYGIQTIRTEVKGYRRVYTNRGRNIIPVMYVLVGIPVQSDFTQELLTRWKTQNKGIED